MTTLEQQAGGASAPSPSPLTSVATSADMPAPRQAQQRTASPAAGSNP